MKKVAERLQEVGDNDKLKRDDLRDSLIPIIADLKKAGDWPMSLVPAPVEPTDNNAKASDPEGADSPRTDPESSDGRTPGGAP
jgi:hypothetical protein